MGHARRCGYDGGLTKIWTRYTRHVPLSPLSLHFRLYRNPVCLCLILRIRQLQYRWRGRSHPHPPKAPISKPWFTRCGDDRRLNQRKRLHLRLRRRSGRPTLCSGTKLDGVSISGDDAFGKVKNGFDPSFMIYPLTLWDCYRSALLYPGRKRRSTPITSVPMESPSSSTRGIG